MPLQSAVSHQKTTAFTTRFGNYLFIYYLFIYQLLTCEDYEFD